MREIARSWPTLDTAQQERTLRTPPRIHGDDLGRAARRGDRARGLAGRTPRSRPGVDEPARFNERPRSYTPVRRQDAWNSSVRTAHPAASGSPSRPRPRRWRHGIGGRRPRASAARAPGSRFRRERDGDLGQLQPDAGHASGPHCPRLAGVVRRCDAYGGGLNPRSSGRASTMPRAHATGGRRRRSQPAGRGDRCGYQSRPLPAGEPARRPDERHHTAYDWGRNGSGHHWNPARC